VPDGPKSYVWVVPNAPSTQCAVRVRQHGGAMEDVSKSTFSITVPYCLTASSLDVGTSAVGAVRSAALTLVNGGTAPLTISAAGTDDTQFWAGRQNLVVPAGQSDTLGIYYRPTAAGYDSATLTVAGDDPFTPHVVKVKGRGRAGGGGGGGEVTAFACWPNRPNPFTGRTAIRYALPVRRR
jgi:hypothetical protein